MYLWEISRGRRVRIRSRALPFHPDPGPMRIIEWPCRGLLREYVRCRNHEGRDLWFRPEELLPS
jgi:hypothetical protein